MYAYEFCTGVVKIHIRKRRAYCFVLNIRKKRGNMPRHYEDFFGTDINGVIIKGLDEKSGGAGKHKRWICECSTCHKEFTVQSNHLIEKKTSCCPECNSTKREDLTGHRFNHLTVDYMIPVSKYERSMCSCTCDCGATGVVVQANHLKSGETKSCGCMLSYPEELIAQLLDENGVDYIKQKKFPKLRYIKPLRFDFYLPDKNMVIEYNGEQHYKPIDYYGGEESFEIAKRRDQIKREYCADNKIDYLVIRFDEDIKDILIENKII